MYCEWGARAPACEDVEYAGTNDACLGMLGVVES